MKTIKLPRKLKKALKKAILTGDVWSTRDVRIYGVRSWFNRFGEGYRPNQPFRIHRAVSGDTYVSNYTVGLP